MVLNQATDYALRMLLFLAKQDNYYFVDATFISEEEKIPKRFLFKIARDLIRVGMIKSIRGKNGGFMIWRNPEEITLYEVIEAIEGPILLNKCLIDSNKCNKNAAVRCFLRKELEKSRNGLIHKFQSINLKMLLEGA